jgi:hypothetical protein
MPVVYSCKSRTRGGAGQFLAVKLDPPYRKYIVHRLESVSRCFGVCVCVCVCVLYARTVS